MLPSAYLCEIRLLGVFVIESKMQSRMAVEAESRCALAKTTLRKANTEERERKKKKAFALRVLFSHGVVKHLFHNVEGSVS